MINMEEEYQILEEALEEHIFQMACDPQGTHVLQKLVFLDGVTRNLIDNLYEIWKDSKGLSVVKKIIAFHKDKSKISHISSMIQKDLIRICQSNFGQYIIQQILESWDDEDITPIFAEIQKNLSVLSLNKYSNLVLEKWKEKASPELIHQYFQMEIP